LKKGGSGYPLYPRYLDYHQGIGMPLLSLTRASRSKQGTKIEELGFWGKENENTSWIYAFADKF
jgi:hypothetical protein